MQFYYKINWRARQSLKVVFSSSSTAHILSTYLNFCCLLKANIVRPKNSPHVVASK